MNGYTGGKCNTFIWNHTHNKVEKGLTTVLFHLLPYYTTTRICVQKTDKPKYQKV